MHRSITALMRSYGDNPDWQDILKVVRDHTIDHETTVDEVLAELEAVGSKEAWTRSDVVTCFKEFRDLGLATITKGVKSKKTRLTWMFPPRAVADAAMGSPEELQRLLAGSPVAAAATLGEFKGKQDWSLDDVIEAMSQITGLPTRELHIRLTIPEARRLLANSQGIPVEDVHIRMG